MKSPRRRSLLIAAAFALPALAHAHPGHDGDHGLVWDFQHLTSHPLATIACGSVLAAAAWGVWRLVSSAKSHRAKRE